MIPTPSLLFGGDDDKDNNNNGDDGKIEKYHDGKYNDQQIEGIGKYFRIDGYPNLLPFLIKLTDS